MSRTFVGSSTTKPMTANDAVNNTNISIGNMMTNVQNLINDVNNQLAAMQQKLDDFGGVPDYQPDIDNLKSNIAKIQQDYAELSIPPNHTESINDFRQRIEQLEQTGASNLTFYGFRFEGSDLIIDQNIEAHSDDYDGYIIAQAGLNFSIKEGDLIVSVNNV